MKYSSDIYKMPVSVVLQRMATDCKRRRLERGLSRKSLSELSGVPAPSIERFETKHKISLESYAQIANALDFTDELVSVMSKPKYHTIGELEAITKNKTRQRGR